MIYSINISFRKFLELRAPWFDKQFGAENWDYRATYDGITIFFKNEEDRMMFILKV